MLECRKVLELPTCLWLWAHLGLRVALRLRVVLPLA